MEDDLYPSPVSLYSKGLGMWSERENGEGERNIPTKEFMRNFIFSPKIINHNGNLGVKNRFKSGWCRWNKGEMMGDSIQNLNF